MWTTTITIVSLGIIFSIQWLEHARLRNANGVVLFYWLFLLIALAVKLRSLISQQLYTTDRAYFVTYCVGGGLAVLAFLVEWQWPKPSSQYEALVEEEECPAEYATIFSRLTFSWMTPLMKFGYKNYLTEEDLWALQKSDTTKTTGAAFDKAWEYELEHREHPSLWLASTYLQHEFFSLLALDCPSSRPLVAGFISMLLDVRVIADFANQCSAPMEDPMRLLACSRC